MTSCSAAFGEKCVGIVKSTVLKIEPIDFSQKVLTEVGHQMYWDECPNAFDWTLGRFILHRTQLFADFFLVNPVPGDLNNKTVHCSFIKTAFLVRAPEVKL